MSGASGPDRSCDGMLATALGDAAHARAMRALSGISELVAYGGSVSAEAVLEAIGFRAKSLLALERLTGAPAAATQLNQHLERFLTLYGMKSATLRWIETSLRPVLAYGGDVHCVTAALHEVMHAIETMIPAGGEPKVRVTLRLVPGRLILAISCRCARLRAVPSKAGAAALTRAERIARLTSGGCRRSTAGANEMRILLRLGAVTESSAAPEWDI